MCIAAGQLGFGSSVEVTRYAWGFVAARLAHSVIHITFNHVLSRMLAFIASFYFLVRIAVILSWDLDTPILASIEKCFA